MEKIDNKIDNNEKLAILGFSDPNHSLAWYRERFEELPRILERFIVDVLNDFGTFPGDVNKIDKKLLYHKYYLLIECNSGKYIVKVINTDRGQISKEYAFNNANKAARCFINKSYTAGAAINQYWELSE